MGSSVFFWLLADGWRDKIAPSKFQSTIKHLLHTDLVEDSNFDSVFHYFIELPNPEAQVELRYILSILAGLIEKDRQPKDWESHITHRLMVMKLGK